MKRTATCIDCRVEFTYEYRAGPTRQRCEACLLERKRASQRERSQKWKNENRDHHVAYMREYHHRHKDDPEYRSQRREAFLRYKYNLTQAELDALLEAQGHRCAICGGERNGPGTRLHIDHCHDSGKVRGLLCAKCNTAVGLLNNDPARARAVAEYLER